MSEIEGPTNTYRAATIQQLDDAAIERVARAIWAVRPDCRGKPWPLETNEQKRAYPHNPITACDLCFVYAKAALGSSGGGLVSAFPKGSAAAAASANSGVPECAEDSTPTLNRAIQLLRGSVGTPLALCILSNIVRDLEKEVNEFMGPEQGAAR